MRNPLLSLTRSAPFWRNVKFLRFAFQVFVLLVVGLILYWLWGNYQTNVARSSIPTDFRFLDNPANFTIPGNDFDQSQPVRSAFAEGFYNTLRVAIVGILLATLLGTLVGIGRLSKNFMVRKLAEAFVEIIRNLPLLVLLTFMNLAVVLQTFPRIEEAWTPLDVMVISNRGIAIPWFIGSATNLAGIFALALVIAYLVKRVRMSYSDRTGKPANDILFALITFLAIVVFAWIALGFSFELPYVDDRATAGGLRLDPSFFALLVALVLYTSSQVAEIVRGSILAVNKGQGEAADALALSASQKMRIVILPQAFRIAMPALGNQYLNLIKNSSLGASISYFELTQVAQITVGNGSPAVPAFTLTLLVYLSISLVTSFVVNYFNRKLELVER
jgi:general L-amino acid transport system permease protein